MLSLGATWVFLFVFFWNIENQSAAGDVIQLNKKNKPNLFLKKIKFKFNFVSSLALWISFSENIQLVLS